MSQARMYEDALNDSNTGTSSGTVVSANTTEEQMDNAFVTYTADSIETEALSSDELTTIMLNAMGSTNTGLGSVWCNNVTLADGTHMDLPSIDVLMRIYQARELIDAVDPTLASNPNKGLVDHWGAGSTNSTCFASNGTTVSNGYIPRANAGISTLAPSQQNPITYCWCVQTSGNTLVGNINSNRGAIPVLEIEV